MKFINKIIVLGLLLAGFQSFAQQDPMYTQYMFNLTSVNSAAVGRGDNVELMMVDRFQWVGFEGAPKTMSLTADIPIKFFSCGAGVTYVLDKVGPEKSHNLYIDYAYHLKLNRNMRLGMGLKTGFKVYSADIEHLGNTNDNVFDQNIDSKFLPNFGLGLFLYSEKYYVGVSTPKLVNHRYEGDSISGGEERHFFVVGGYVFPINDDIVFKPSVMSKMVKGSPMSVDVTANFLFREMLWAGIGYRSGDAVTLITQFHVSNRFKVGYAYDFTTSKIRKASSGSHEIMLSYEFKSFKEKVRSPRYF